MICHHVLAFDFELKKLPASILHTADFCSLKFERTQKSPETVKFRELVDDIK